MDSFKRTLAKTITWRVIATTITLGTVFAFTGSLGQASTITLTAAGLLIFGYYIHERSWDKSSWGRRKVSTRSEKSRRAH